MRQPPHPGDGVARFRATAWKPAWNLDKARLCPRFPQGFPHRLGISLVCLAAVAGFDQPVRRRFDEGVREAVRQVYTATGTPLVKGGEVKGAGSPG